MAIFDFNSIGVNPNSPVSQTWPQLSGNKQPSPFSPSTQAQIPAPRTPFGLCILWQHTEYLNAWQKLSTCSLLQFPYPKQMKALTAISGVINCCLPIFNCSYNKTKTSKDNKYYITYTTEPVLLQIYYIFSCKKDFSDILASLIWK